jgi:hypothetical protein
LGIREDEDFRIHSFATDQNSNFRVATISFRLTPELLDGTKKEWPLELPQPVGAEYRPPHILYFDLHFHGFTPISPIENDNNHLVE